MKKTLLFLFVLALALILSVPQTHATTLSISINNNADNAGNIFWNVNATSTCILQYSVGSDFSSASSVNGQLISSGTTGSNGIFYFSAQLTNLAANSDYYYRAVCTTADGQNITSETKLTNLSVYNQPLASIIISNLGVPDSTVSSSSLTVAWVTNVDTDSIVYYKASSDTSWSWQGTDALTTNHSVVLTGLNPSTSYLIYVNAKDANGIVVKSANIWGQTAGVGSQILATLSITKTGVGMGSTPAGSGTVTDNGNTINCGTTCSGEYNIGTTVILTAAPAADSVFGSWTGCGVTNAEMTNQVCTIQLTGPTHVNASFLSQSYEQITQGVHLSVNNFKSIDNQPQFDLVNSGVGSVSFFLSVWDNTTNKPLQSTAGQTEQYNLSPSQTVHVYLLNNSNVTSLSSGLNSLTIKEVSLDSQTVYNSQDFSVNYINDSSKPQSESEPVLSAGQDIKSLISSTYGADYLNHQVTDPSAVKSGLILFRVIRDCATGQPVGQNYPQLTSFGPGRLVNGYLQEVNLDTANYYNYTCNSRFQEQCINDGTFDSYYDEFCATGAVTASPATTAAPVTPAATVISINDNASQLYSGSIDSLLAQLNEMKNTIAEQAAQIKYLQSLTQNVASVSSSTLSNINSFITYGVDSNTLKLGAGQRAAVVNSFKSAFARLPTTQTDFTDVVKIANGRWPGQTSSSSIAWAEQQFQKVYLRAPDMSNAHDNAAVTIMAYGLMQQAANRNLKSETASINIFKGIFSRVPTSANDWNTVAAIAYSGATR